MNKLLAGFIKAPQQYLYAVHLSFMTMVAIVSDDLGSLDQAASAWARTDDLPADELRVVGKRCQDLGKAILLMVEGREDKSGPTI